MKITITNFNYNSAHLWLRVHTCIHPLYGCNMTCNHIVEPIDTAIECNSQYSWMKQFEQVGIQFRLIGADMRGIKSAH